jgi:hypothetical protein
MTDRHGHRCDEANDDDPRDRRYREHAHDVLPRRAVRPAFEGVRCTCLFEQRPFRGNQYDDEQEERRQEPPSMRDTARASSATRDSSWNGHLWQSGARACGDARLARIMARAHRHGAPSPDDPSPRYQDLARGALLDSLPLSSAPVEAHERTCLASDQRAA